MHIHDNHRPILQFQHQLANGEQSIRTYLGVPDNEELKIEDINVAGTNFANANLSNTILTRSDFGEADYTNADFTNSSIIHTQMWGAICPNATFVGTVFKTVNFTNADLRGANFTGAQFEDVRDLLTATVDQNTIFSLSSLRQNNMSEEDIETLSNRATVEIDTSKAKNARNTAPSTVVNEPKVEPGIESAKGQQL